MKIEMLESLCYSYLRHVKQCWVVQTNWKVSEHWSKHMSSKELDRMFESMRERFDPDGSVLKKTKDAAQFLQQAEIDVVGVGQDGSVYALDVAFHEAGLNYGGGPHKRVLKKLLRAVMILKAYVPAGTGLHVYFVSPKVNPGVQQPLEDIFESLKVEYPEIEWELLTNGAFAEQMLEPTLQKAEEVADTSELFMRAVKLRNLAGFSQRNGQKSNGNRVPDRIQPLVQALMTTLLEDHSNLLNEADLRDLMDRDRCKNILNLRIGNFPLLLEQEDLDTNSRSRYYRELYGGRFYVCSQWGRQFHFQNAQSLLQFVNELIERKRNNSGIPALERSRKALREYLGQPAEA